MGVAKKYRRKIEIQGRGFLWYVREDLDWLAHSGCSIALSIISEDKQLIISYGIGQAETHCHLVSLGQEFFKLAPHNSSGYRRVRCPQWEKDGAITPEIVRQIIEWGGIYDADAIEVNWRGETLEVSCPDRYD
jgi:hypothetical protein